MNTTANNSAPKDFSDHSFTEFDRLSDKKRVLIVEDDSFSRHLFAKILDENFRGLEVHYCRDYESALRCIQTNPQYHLLIIDVFLGSQNGLDLYHKVMDQEHPPMVIMTSALARNEFLKMLSGTDTIPSYLEKPFRIDSCVNLIEALEDKQT